MLSLALAACGGGGGDRPDAAEVDPKTAYVKAASQVCRDADAQFARLTPPTAPTEFGPYVTQTVQIAESVQADLAALTPPERDRADLERKVLQPFAALVASGKEFSARVTAAGADEAQLLPLLAERPTSTAIDKEYLRSYGLKSCADAVSRVG